jgi:hypothetical protein
MNKYINLKFNSYDNYFDSISSVTFQLNIMESKRKSKFISIQLTPFLIQKGNI